MKKVIQDLKNNKSTEGEIPIRILKECEFTFEFLKNSINKSIEDGSFRDSLNKRNIARIFKKDDPFNNSNYRPVRISPLFSKVYGWLNIISFEIILKDS